MPRASRIRLPAARALAAALLLAPAPAAALKVTVSIQPVHSLVAGVMAGAGEPSLVVKGYGSPHAYQMRPSEAAALYGADLVFWMGVPLETFLEKSLANVEPPARVVTLLDSHGLELLPNRDSGVWSGHPENSASVDAGGARTRDPHVWLSPARARRLVAVIADALSAADADNAALYRRNAESLSRRMVELETRIDARLAPVRQVPFIMFHDALQYFEHAFGLRTAGALQLEPARLPGAARVRALRKAIRERGVRCIFREPQFQSALVETLAEDLKVKIAVVDPLGADLDPGPEAWFGMMERNGEAVAGCLGLE